MFATYEELMAAVDNRRNDTLTLEIDMGGEFSPEYEEAKQELAQAKALRQLAGQAFLADDLAALEAKVEKLKPKAKVVFARFSRLKVSEWALLVKQGSSNPVEQYEKVLPKTFVGLYGRYPEEDAEPLATDFHLMSSESPNCILPGGALHKVVQAFIAWQNSSGDVSIRPTKSGQG